MLSWLSPSYKLPYDRSGVSYQLSVCCLYCIFLKPKSPTESSMIAAPPLFKLWLLYISCHTNSHFSDTSHALTKTTQRHMDANSRMHGQICREKSWMRHNCICLTPKNNNSDQILYEFSTTHLLKPPIFLYSCIVYKLTSCSQTKQLK